MQNLKLTTALAITVATFNIHADSSAQFGWTDSPRFKNRDAACKWFQNYYTGLHMQPDGTGTRLTDARVGDFDPKHWRFFIGTQGAYECLYTLTHTIKLLEWRPDGSTYYVYRSEVTKDSPFRATIYCPKPDLYFDKYTGKCGCRDGEILIDGANECTPVIDYFSENQLTCAGSDPQLGNPISPLRGRKTQSIEIIQSATLPLSLTYDTTTTLGRHEANTNLGVDKPKSFGNFWTSNFDKRLLFQTRSEEKGILAYRGGGLWIDFRVNGTNIESRTRSHDLLKQTEQGWLYLDANKNSIEIYNKEGTLQSITKINGLSTSITYNGEVATDYGPILEKFPTTVSDNFDRTLIFAPHVTPKNFEEVYIGEVYFNNRAIAKFRYDTLGNLTSTEWNDGGSKKFLYELDDLKFALTGIIDEAGTRISTYKYDEAGRAIQTENGKSLNKYSIKWSSPPELKTTTTYDQNLRAYKRRHEWTLPENIIATTPNGNQILMGAERLNNIIKPTYQSNPAGSGCLSATKTIRYDNDGNVSELSGFNGDKTCITSDHSRGIELNRLDGLKAADECTKYSASSSAIPVYARRTSSQWHPDWHLQTKVAEPHILRTSVYNGQPDPFAGSATASCAPSNALLPDGKPIVVLCKRVEQATTDVDGSKGFAATLQAGVPARVWSYTYNEFGQVLTEKDPLNNVTSRSYYSETTNTHTKGDLESIRNPLGQITRFTEYDPMGQVLKMVDANEVVTEYRYDLRQRLTDVIVNGASLNRYEYWPTGLLKRAVQADDSFVAYEYDDAHRLTAVADAKGNRIEYTLDNAGQRTAEKVKDPSGSLARQLTRVHDALGRVQQLTGRN